MTKLDNLSDDTRDELAALALKLSGNQKTRKGFLGLIKQAAPETPIPEIDEVAAVNAEIEKRDKRIQELEQKFDQRFLQEDLSKTKNSVREKFGLSDDDFSKMEKMMTEKQLPADYNWAAPLYKQQTDAATPTNWGSDSGVGPLDIEKNAGTVDGLMDDTDNWARRTAHQMIDDMHKHGKASSF